MKVCLNDEVRFYLNDVAKGRLLSREDEVALFKRLAAGDESARDEIIEANLRFVIKVALQFAGRGVAIADLIQEGNIGLLEVVDKFDYRRGYRFSTYAAFWIRQAIQLALRKQSNVIRLPIRKSRMLGHMNEAVKNFSATHGRAPSARELALLLDMEECKVEELLRLRDSVLSLDMETDEDGNQLLSRLSDDTSPSALDRSMERERTERVEEALGQLTDKERKVVKLRFGFGGGRELSLRNTSQLVGMSQEGVRRVERKALKKLRRPGTREAIHGLL
jgi:RNA polymerase primary sigma factor